jgi:integrase
MLCGIGTKRNERAGLDDRWTKRVKGDDGKMHTVDSALMGKVTRWRVRWVVDGKECTKSFGRKPDAQAYLNKITADVVRGDYVDPRKAGETFGTVAEQWYAAKAHRKPKTLAGYRGLLDTLILPRWRHVPLKDVDFQGLSMWLIQLGVNGSQQKTPLSPSRIRQAHNVIHQVLKYAQRSGKVMKNVAADIERKYDLPTENERPKHYLTHAQLLGLASHAERFETLTLVLGYCGLRFGEAAALYRTNVDTAKRELIIRYSATAVTGKGMVQTGTKTNQNRRVAVPQPVWDRLVKELPDDGAALVFPGRKPGHLRLGEYRWTFDKAVRAMQAATTAQRQREVDGTGEAVTPEFPTITPHELRHTCASLALSEMPNIKALQNMLGHASATMTLDKYGHLMNDDLTGVASALGKAINATAVPLRYL